MLEIIIPAREFFDEEKNEFIVISETKLKLEHSLVSLSRWESKWKKPYNDGKQKSFEESIDYIRCMTITQNVNPMVYMGITPEIMKTISDYIDDPMTATWFSDKKEKSRSKGSAVTAEIIYYWMFSLGIPLDCEKWHLNRLMTQIRVCDSKNKPPKKMSRKEIMKHNTALNEARRNQYRTNG